MRSGGWKYNSSLYCNSTCVRSQAMPQPPPAGSPCCLGPPQPDLRNSDPARFLLLLPQLWARFVCNVMMKPASSAQITHIRCWRLEAAGSHPASSDRQVWVPVFTPRVLSHPSGFTLSLLLLFLPSFLPDCKPKPPDMCVQTHITAHQLP